VTTNPNRGWEVGLTPLTLSGRADKSNGEH